VGGVDLRNQFPKFKPVLIQLLDVKYLVIGYLLNPTLVDDSSAGHPAELRTAD